MEFGSLTPLEGGWSGETFVADLAQGERAVVRIHARRPERAEVDAALMRLVRGLLPVPDVLEVRRGDAAADLPALLVTQFLPGVRGDLLLPTLDDAGLAVVGRQMGDLAARLAGMPTLVPGAFVGPDLRIETWDLPDGLPGFVEATHLDQWESFELDALASVAEAAQDILDAVRRTSVVHSDLNPKNVLIDPDTRVITALLDWEFAHSGSPFTDLGNVLRFERHPAYVAAALAAFEEREGTAPSEALALARAADLWALVDLAGRRAANPVAERAHGLLREVVRDSTQHSRRA
ncbi:MAG: phosphotransferase [Nocardioides sp.]